MIYLEESRDNFNNTLDFMATELQTHCMCVCVCACWCLHNWYSIRQLTHGERAVLNTNRSSADLCVTQLCSWLSSSTSANVLMFRSVFWKMYSTSRWKDCVFANFSSLSANHIYAPFFQIFLFWMHVLDFFFLYFVKCAGNRSLNNCCAMLQRAS